MAIDDDEGRPPAGPSGPTPAGPPRRQPDEDDGPRAAETAEPDQGPGDSRLRDRPRWLGEDDPSQGGEA